MQTKIIASMALATAIFMTQNCVNFDNQAVENSSKTQTPLTSDPMPKYYFSEPLLFNFSTHEQDDLFNFDQGSGFNLRLNPDFVSIKPVQLIDESESLIFSGARETSFLIVPDTAFYQGYLTAQTKLLIAFNKKMKFIYWDKNETAHQLNFMFSVPISDAD